MPVTTLDLPDELLDDMDKLIQQGLARSRKEIIAKAVENFLRLRMYEWEPPILRYYGYRAAIITQRTYQALISDINEQAQYEAGLRMGQTLRDLCFAHLNVDTHERKNWKIALKLFQDLGAGIVSLTGDTIIIDRPYHPLPLLHGYLKTALASELELLKTMENVAIFNVGSKGEKPTAKETVASA